MTGRVISSRVGGATCGGGADWATASAGKVNNRTPAARRARLLQREPLNIRNWSRPSFTRAPFPVVSESRSKKVSDYTNLTCIHDSKFNYGYMNCGLDGRNRTRGTEFSRHDEA